MRLQSLRNRRPSLAIAISVAALFMSLGGVGYAATQAAQQQRRKRAASKRICQLPQDPAQRRRAGAANTGQLQERVTGTCASGSAIGTVNKSGKVVCNTALPTQVGTIDNTTSIGATATTVTSAALPAGASYLAFADSSATATSGPNAACAT